METQDNHNNDQDAPSNQPLKTQDDKRAHNIDANQSISEMREDAEKAKGDKLADQPGDRENGKEDDAMNYKSDRENGAYNAKHA